MKYGVTYPERLRNLCIENGWFSSGDPKLERILFANENGFNIIQISAIIFVTTEGVLESSIYSALVRERKFYLASVSSDV